MPEIKKKPKLIRYQMILQSLVTSSSSPSLPIHYSCCVQFAINIFCLLTSSLPPPVTVCSSSEEISATEIPLLKKFSKCQIFSSVQFSPVWRLLPLSLDWIKRVYITAETNNETCSRNKLKGKMNINKLIRLISREKAKLKLIDE